MKKFEYKTVFLDVSKFYKWTGKIKFESGEIDSLLNELGSEGWELVSADSNNYLDTSQAIYLFFKRERIF